MHNCLRRNRTLRSIGYHTVMSSKFKKKVEDFICEHCGAEVAGNGYTNHCPKCLWSKHVDINPGDRAASCGGLMEPAHIEGSTGKGYMIIHRCVRCGHTRKNSVLASDDTDAVIALARHHF